MADGHCGLPKHAPMQGNQKEVSHAHSRLWG
jgi:hypothetical protein